jgi:ABC-2 type transport system ATP-binding protein
VDALLAEHKLLVGPHREPSTVVNTAGVAAVVQATYGDKQTTLVVRTNGSIHDPAWTVSDLNLEELVLAYLANSSAGARPGPSRIEVRS